VNIVYVYGRDWPSEKAGISFSTYTGYGIAENGDENNVDMIFARNTNENINEVLKSNFEIEIKNNFNIHLLDNSSILSETTKFYFQAFNKIRKLHKKNMIDVVITRTVKFLPFMYILKSIYNITVIYEAHSFYLDPDFKNEYDRKKEFLYQKYTLNKLDGIICHQKILKELYQNYIPKQNYCIARTGIKELHYNNNLWENNYIGYIGSLYESKGVKDLFYAFKNIDDKNLKLLIIGGRAKRINKYNKLAEELGIKDRVEITGWLSKSEMNKYLKKIKIGVVPIKDTFHNRYLTSPMKIFDYFSHGIPVVANDLPPVREIVTENGGLFFENGNIDSLVKTLNKMNSSKKKYKHYSSYILKRAEKLTWKNRGEKILNFVKDVKVQEVENGKIFN
jgi:glycosyltransferase involved in cell wall biosynthesis